MRSRARRHQKNAECAAGRASRSAGRGCGAGADHLASPDAQLVAAIALAARQAVVAAMARSMSVLQESAARAVDTAASPGTPAATPPVDIVVPVYNAVDELRHCVHSILAHTSGNYRLVLIDD